MNGLMGYTSENVSCMDFASVVRNAQQTNEGRSDFSTAEI